MIDKYQLKEQLKNGIVTIVFEKSDGTERVLKGTLLTEYLPDHLKNENDPGRKHSEDVIPVWDVENKGWRSFRVDSVKQVLTE